MNRISRYFVLLACLAIAIAAYAQDRPATQPTSQPTTQPANFDAWKSGKMEPAVAWRTLLKSINARPRVTITKESINQVMVDLLLFAKLYPDVEQAGYALFNHGMISINLGDYEQAEKSLTQAANLAKHPQFKMMVKMHLAETRIRPGANMPKFKAKTLDGKQFTSDDLKGKIVLLDFWATWCRPCIMELPNVRKIHETYKDKGLVIISINLDDEEGMVRQFIDRNSMPWTHIFNAQTPQGKDIATKFGVNPIPNGILIGKDGKIIGAMLSGPRLAMAVEQAFEPPAKDKSDKLPVSKSSESDLTHAKTQKRKGAKN
jgi:thiol-disulfide isomerase/thioredoxin